MAESYRQGFSDERLRTMVLDADRGFGNVELLTYRRLMKERDVEREEADLLRTERDEARRVARSVASDWMTYLLNGTLRDPAPDVDTALAYPEVSE
jgi:hypothetical protein